MKESIKSIIAVGLFISGFAVADNRIDQVLPDAPELAPYGEQAIGVQTLQLINPNQIDIINVNDESLPLYDRPLTVEVWYPAASNKRFSKKQKQTGV